MAQVMKHFARAIEYKLWLLLGYLALSLASNLVEGTAIAKYLTGPWWAVSLMGMGFMVLDVFWVKGMEILSPLYQQIPRKPIELLVCHFTVAFGCVLLFLVSYTTFAWHGSSLMPDGFSWLVALNILSLSLYTTALGLAILSVLVLFAVNKDRWPRIASLLGVAVVTYLLALHVGSGILTLIELASSPMAGLTAYGEIIIADSVLHAPWDIGVTNVAQVSFLLLLQGGTLTYLLSGRVDVA